MGTDEFLLGYRDLRRLGIISSEFSLNKCEKDSIQFYKIKENFIKEFPKVLSYTLDENAMVGGTPMTIHLCEGHGPPKRTSVACQVLLHWADKAERAVAELISSKRMVRVEEPTQWCAPGMWVLKDNGELRLVVDYHDLNKAI